MILGEWVVAEGAIYDMYDEQQHVVDELPEMRRYWAGVDYGTSNPFVAILLGLGVDGRLYAVSEWRHDARAVHRQMTDAQYSRAVREWIAERDVRPEWTFIDPSATSFSTQLWADGYPNVARANNTVLDGIHSVANALDAGRLLIHRSCEGLLAEFSTYVWDDAAAARGEDRPVKQDDHSLDALRYVVHSTVHEWRGLLVCPLLRSRPVRCAAARTRARRGGDRVPRSLTDRFLDKVTPGPLGCWDWTAHIKPNGYGQIKVAGRPQYAHRVAYELVRGPIPRGLVIDHLCRRRHCANTDHLEVVTTRTSIRRGISPAARRARQKHCARGHRFDQANMYRAPNGTRHCRPCAAQRARVRRV